MKRCVVTLITVLSILCIGPQQYCYAAGYHITVRIEANGDQFLLKDLVIDFDSQYTQTLEQALQNIINQTGTIRFNNVYVYGAPPHNLRHLLEAQLTFNRYLVNDAEVNQQNANIGDVEPLESVNSRPVGPTAISTDKIAVVVGIPIEEPRVRTTRDAATTTNDPELPPREYTAVPITGTHTNHPEREYTQQGHMVVVGYPIPGTNDAATDTDDLAQWACETHVISIKTPA